LVVGYSASQRERTVGAGIARRVGEIRACGGLKYEKRRDKKEDIAIMNRSKKEV